MAFYHLTHEYEEGEKYAKNIDVEKLLEIK